MTGRDYIDILSDEELASWIRQRVLKSTARSDILKFLTAEEPYKDSNLAEIGPAPRNSEEVEERRAYRLKEQWSDSSIGELDLTVRAYNLLYCAGFKSVGSLIGLRKYDIQRLRNCGRYTADEVAMKLERLTKYAMKP